MKTQEVINHIVAWLTDYATSAKVNGFVVGVSGGIDSAVVSALAARTGLPVLCIEMPIHQPVAQVNRAWEHMESLRKEFSNVRALRTDLTSLFDGFVNALPQHENQENHERALVNTRARLRMTTLYYYAQLHNYLVVGTGNKVEDFGVGFYTKYGDGGVDLSPIADLVKTEVFKLGFELGVPESILTAKPTDGLWGDDRSDEDQIGASYPELEWAMANADKAFETGELTERQAEVMAIYMRLNKMNRHKMIPIPVCTIPNQLKK
jgi:NAD+ synthase